MNGFEIIDVSAVVISVALDSASRKWTTLLVTDFDKEENDKKIDFIVTIRTMN